MFTKLVVTLLLVAVAKGQNFPRYVNEQGQSVDPYYYNQLVEAESKVDPVSVAGSAFRSLSWFTKGIVAIIFLPILLPLVLAPLILIALIIYFIPVIRIELGSSARSRQIGEALAQVDASARFLYAMVTEEECLDRMLCETGRASSKPMTEWIETKFGSSENWISKRLSRILRIASGRGTCTELRCRSAGRRGAGIWSKWSSG